MINERDFLIYRNRLLKALGLRREKRKDMDPWLLPPSRRTAGAREGIAIAAIFKDEAPYLEEWIEFHALLGVRAFFLYDNGSTDGSAELLDAGGFSAAVTRLPWWSFDGMQSTQNFAHAHMLANFAADFRWVAFIDVDEFLMPADGDDLGATLGRFEHLPCVSLPWICFGPNGHKTRPEGLVIESYTERAALPHDPRQFSLLRYKSIVDPAAVTRAGTHHFGLEGRGNVFINEAGEAASPEDARREGFPRAEHLRLHHYFTRSEAELEAKLDKGRVSKNGEIDRSTYPRRMAQFALSAHRDETALRFAPALKTRLAARQSTVGAATGPTTDPAPEHAS
ncbi:MAG: glycosyltransferase family 2 protein [Pseudomonadota bacterium]